MKKTERIEEFIHACFDSFCLTFDDYFCYKDRSGKKRRIPLIRNGTLDKEAVGFASRILGIPVSDIMACNYDAIKKWTDKYAYFSYFKGLDRAYEENMCGPRYAEHKLKEAIFGKRLPFPVSYNWMAVKDRLSDQLMELDRHLPGTYHYGAELTDLKVSVQKICHYNKIGEFVEEYLQMLDRAATLFFKAFEEELSEEEIHEYNLLVSVLGIRDFVCGEIGNLYYDNLLRCREIYRREALPNFYDYITLAPGRAFDPWRCAEFTEDRSLVQRYINYHPYFKFAMREFAMNVLNFKFSFAWSDAKLICIYDEKEISEKDYEILFGEPVPESCYAPERTEVYVPKTENELEDNEEYAKRLLVLSGPEKLGGIIYPAYRNEPGDVSSAKRIMERMPLIRSTEYAEWYKQTHGQALVLEESSGGGSDA